VVKGGCITCRLHISRRYAVLYGIDKEAKKMIVREILPIEQAHKKYG
jgi:hypothetical protein